MKKMIATLAIAGLGAALATGAQAQTTPSFSGSVGYSVTLARTVTQLSATVYQYTYSVSSFTPDGGTVNAVVFSGIGGFLGGQTQSNFGGTATASGTPTSIFYTQGALTSASTFTFLDSQAPSNTTIGVVGSDSAGGVNVGGLVLGPGAIAVPEAGSFALLGLGLLPLAFVARRRISRNA